MFGITSYIMRTAACNFLNPLNYKKLPENFQYIHFKNILILALFVLRVCQCDIESTIKLLNNPTACRFKHSQAVIVEVVFRRIHIIHYDILVLTYSAIIYWYCYLWIIVKRKERKLTIYTRVFSLHPLRVNLGVEQINYL